MSNLGIPCWFELMTSDLDEATAFYEKVFGWTINDAGMEGFTYLLAGTNDGLVAGLMSKDMMGPEAADAPSMWMVYIACDDGEATIDKIVNAGGTVTSPLAEIPGTGRFAVIQDPQGATFGLLEPLPMENPTVGAFDQGRPGHASWIELMSPDNAAALEFYGTVFGWTASQLQPTMSGDMSYQVIARDGVDIGGLMPQMAAPMPVWNVYFEVPDTIATATVVTESGGSVHHGPAELPGGGRMMAVLADPQGATFEITSQTN